MSTRTPKPSLKPSAVATAVAEATYTPPAPPTAEELHQEVSVALAAQGGAKINHLWDDLNAMHDDTIANITKVGQEVAGQMVAFSVDPTRRAEVAPWRQERLKKLMTQFEMDTGLHFADLDTIQEQHKDLSGGVENADQFMKVLSLQGDYAQRQELHQILTMPQVTEMLEITGAVELNPAQPNPAVAANDTDHSQQA